MSSVTRDSLRLEAEATGHDEPRIGLPEPALSVLSEIASLAMTLQGVLLKASDGDDGGYILAAATHVADRIGYVADRALLAAGEYGEKAHADEWLLSPGLKRALASIDSAGPATGSGE